MNMDYSLTVHSKFLDYTVKFHDRLKLDDFDLCVIDSNVMELHELPNHSALVAISISEENKDLDGIKEIIKIFQDHQIRRSSKVIFIGGGVMQDLGTLAASIYMRGIKWAYCPTTLQAMIDSCIGGKSSINFNSTKNVLGNYYPPSEIQIWPSFLSTLSTDQMISGLIEGTKIAIAADSLKPFVQIFEKYQASSYTAESEIANLIMLSLQSKRLIIQEDEFDLGARKMLNYGHTFGHGIESISNFEIEHGVAVGLGIIAANFLSRELGLIDSDKNLSETTILVLLAMLETDLNFKLDSLDLTGIHHFLRGDKKSTDRGYTFVLPSNSGLILQELPFSSSSDELILTALKSAIMEVRNNEILR
jgi:3-dehydroquinate synthase